MATESDVNLERLRSLLDEQAESPQLDYKASCDLNVRRDLVKLAKHIGAMLTRGGHIVVGADNTGKPSGMFTTTQAKLFDEATLRPKLARFLPPSIETRCAIHELDSHHFALVRVRPHPDGLVAFLGDGDYEENGKPIHAFRKGQIYTRHGTSSEPCDQADIQRVLSQHLDHQKEALRAERAIELADLVRGLQSQNDLARAPSSALTWDLDEATFVSTIIEQLRAGDDIPLRLLLRRAESDSAKALTEKEASPELELVLDRLACLAITLSVLEKDGLFKKVVETFVQIYNLGFDARGMTRRDLAVDAPMLWLLIVERIIAIGAALVREGRWELAAHIVLQRGAGYEFTDKRFPYVTWIRHTTTEASRAGHYAQIIDGKTSDVSLLWIVKELVDKNLCLREGLGYEDERLLDSVCQFDMLAMIVALGAAGTVDTHHYYPHFARFYEHRSLPMLDRLISQPKVREVLFPNRSEQELAEAIRWINHAASQEGFRFAGWDGQLSDTVRQFLEKHPPEQ